MGSLLSVQLPDSARLSLQVLGQSWAVCSTVFIPDQKTQSPFQMTSLNQFLNILSIIFPIIEPIKNDCNNAIYAYVCTAVYR